MKMQVSSFLRTKPLLYSALALYVLGMVLYIDYGLAYQTPKPKQTCCQVAPKTKKKCCADSESCKTPKKATKSIPQESKPCPCPACPCESRPSPTPSTHMILSNDNIIAAQKKQESQDFLHKFFPPKYLLQSSVVLVALPTPPSPTFAGKERLRHYGTWRV